MHDFETVSFATVRLNFADSVYRCDFKGCARKKVATNERVRKVTTDGDFNELARESQQAENEMEFLNGWQCLNGRAG